jgi:hypothetical protein
MNLTPPKLKPLHIGILAVLLALIIGGAMGNFWLMPKLKDNQAKQASIDDLSVKGSDSNLTLANKKLADAKAVSQMTRMDWQIKEARYFRVGGDKQPIDLSDAWAAHDRLADYVNNFLAHDLTVWLKHTGNKVVSPPAVDAIGPNPNDLQKYADIIPIPAKGAKVQGTFSSVMNLLNETRTCPRLITVESVELASSQGSDSTGGTGVPAYFFSTDTVVASIDFTVYIYPRGKYTAVDVPGGENGTSGSAGGGAIASPGRSGLPGGGPPMPGGPPMAGGRARE